MNMTVTNVDRGSVLINENPEHFADDTLTVAAATTIAAGTILARDSGTGFLIPFVKGGTTNEDGIPKTVLTYDVTNEGGAPADLPCRAPTAGTARLDKLIIAADGDNSNVDKAVLDQLRDYSVITVDSTELSVLDNQ